MRTVAMVLGAVLIAGCTAQPRGTTIGTGIGIGRGGTDVGVHVGSTVLGGTSSLGPTRREVPAPRDEVYARVVGSFGSRFLIISSERPNRVQAERMLGGGRANVLAIEFSDAPNDRTYMSVRGWTEITEDTRKDAPRYDISLPNDINDVFAVVSCAVARWPACP